MFARKVFVSVADVQPVLASLRKLDVRYSLDNPVSYGITEYRKAHVAGASFVDLDEEITAHLPNSTARHPLPPSGDFVNFCKRRGIGNKPVLCYDDQSGGLAACRLWWMLQAVGVEAYVLDGGFQSYQAAGLPMADGESTDEPALEQWNYSTTYSKSLELNEIPNESTIVDARFAIRYNSTVRPYGLDTIPGHIPGSRNHPWNSNVDETVAGQKKLHPEEVLRQKWSATLPAGTTNVDRMVFTCASGVTACINIAVATHLGLGTPYLYAGAWSEYCGLNRFHLRQQALAEHGFLLTLQSKALPMNPRATKDNSRVTVDGQEVAFDELAAELVTPVASLHVGEQAVLTLREGKTYEIEVRPAA